MSSNLCFQRTLWFCAEERPKAGRAVVPGAPSGGQGSDPGGRRGCTDGGAGVDGGTRGKEGFLRPAFLVLRSVLCFSHTLTPLRKVSGLPH